MGDYRAGLVANTSLKNSKQVGTWQETKNEPLLIQATKCIPLKNVARERRQSQKVTCCDSFLQLSRKDKKARGQKSNDWSSGTKSGRKGSMQKVKGIFSGNRDGLCLFSPHYAVLIGGQDGPDF